jgi:GNAT superfamily N-acetyltransferase
VSLDERIGQSGHFRSRQILLQKSSREPVKSKNAQSHDTRHRTREQDGVMSNVRPCRDDERAAILAIVNAAAEAYRGVIPADRWHDPYMPPDELDSEIDAGVAFWGYERDGTLVGVIGFQSVRDVDLIRHAYVLPDCHRHGVGGALLGRLQRLSTRRMLVGTWAAADWAIRFYRRHGFEIVSPASKIALLKAYWTVPDRQIETSVVLANPPIDEA